jgi:excisionase family DNA binding protein
MSPPPFTGRPINGSLLLKVSEAAAALRISRSSLYRLFESGELAWVQIGASRRVTSAEIHRFIAAHTEAASRTYVHAQPEALELAARSFAPPTANSGD